MKQVLRRLDQPGHSRALLTLLCLEALRPNSLEDNDVSIGLRDACTLGQLTHPALCLLCYCSWNPLRFITSSITQVNRLVHVKVSLSSDCHAAPSEETAFFSLSWQCSALKSPNVCERVSLDVNLLVTLQSHC